MSSSLAASPKSGDYPPLKGRIKHSVVRWTFKQIPLDELCVAIKQIGFSATSHVPPNDWPTLKKHGVDCSLCWGGIINISRGWANANEHEELVERCTKQIDFVADAGYRNTVIFSGNRRGMDLEEALTNAEVGLKRVLGHAEKRGVTLVMSMPNRIDFPDYLCSNPDWGVGLCKRLGSPNFGLLGDTYHMQLTRGDVIGTIRRFHEYFVYFHTGGVPGRCEIDDRQELNHTAVCRALVDVGYKGYFSQEFIPTLKDPTNAELIALLTKAIHICDV
ncbi:hydroxypyruvate isomerase [Cephaloticoccus primus]|uniref:Hydroxypyruvate isomerase n=1 Tax=Cephaloticoccus primus TaxID=1548207 RepID=A0A139SQ62_9BACT|nr:hydroxypyruvate isomerase [Cephaloticoccus primus]